MTRTPALTAPQADVEVTPFFNPWARLWPLWRHGVALGVLFAALAASVAVRIDVKQATADLHRNERLLREATIDGERLQLELATRRRAVALEAQADALALAELVPVRTLGVAAAPLASREIAGTGAP